MKNFKNLYKCIALTLCTIMIAVSAFGCGGVEDMVSGVAAAGQYPVEVNGVTINSKPQKVVVLSGSLADISIELNTVTQLLAGSEDCTQPDLRDLPKISAMDTQAIIDLGPDVIIASSLSDDMITAFSNANIPAVVLAPATTREDFERLYAQTSAIFSGGGSGYDAGISYARAVFTRMDDLSRVTQSNIITTGCYLYDTESRAVTGDEFGSTILTYAGLTNIFRSLTNSTYDFETLKISNPNVIFCPVGMKDEIMNNSAFSNLLAVRQGKVFEIDEHLMKWQGGSIITTAIEIAGLAFPELLETTSRKATMPDATASPEPTDSSEASASSEDPDASASSESSDSSENEDEADSSDSSSEDPASSEESLPPLETYTELKNGDDGEKVMALQDRLTELKYLTTNYDGHYGDYTFNAISEFQEANSIEKTGIADPATQQKLFAPSAKAKS